MIANIDEARRFATRMRHLGCQFALDDFGSGFSAFFYLKNLPFDYIKIDGDFVRGLDRSPTDQLIVEAIARIADGMRNRTIEPMDLRALVSTLVAGVQATTYRHRIELRPSRVAATGCWDERRLQQVVGNLLTNAVKYSPDGGVVSVTIRGGKRSVTVRVRDHGVGLGSEEVDHVFERFYRAKGIRQLEGTGLGLYICEGIVTAHGGRMWAESGGSGAGSAFCFTLPNGIREPNE